jgi:serine/threonine-protein kinase HipA
MPGSFYTAADKSMFGAIGDSAPDRWGRMLMRRAESRKAFTEKSFSKFMGELDYLLGVSDFSRQGALRFSDKVGGPYLAETEKQNIPPLVRLPELLSATERLFEDRENMEDLRLLLAPGSSLGGARPKASVIDQKNQLYIAKFPRKDDEFNITLWEALALSLAQKAGIECPEWQVKNTEGRSVLLIKRFDRQNGSRIPFISAMSMLGAKDNEQHSYLEIVDALSRYGAQPKQDKVELWRRIVFSILISNTDDHLRNHGFLYCYGSGWRLSPVYDINPTSPEAGPRRLTTAIDFDNCETSLELALSVSSEFGLRLAEAKNIICQIKSAVFEWKTMALRLGLSKAEILRMSGAFEELEK